MQQDFPFAPTGAAQIAVASSVVIAVTAVAQQLTIPTPSSNGATMRLANVGTQVVHWLYGNLTVAATGAAMGVPLLPNTTETFAIPAGFTQLSVIAAAGGSSLYVTLGDGA